MSVEVVGFGGSGVMVAPSAAAASSRLPSPAPGLTAGLPCFQKLRSDWSMIRVSSRDLNKSAGSTSVDLAMLFISACSKLPSLAVSSSSPVKPDSPSSSLAARCLRLISWIAAASIVSS